MRLLPLALMALIGAVLSVLLARSAPAPFPKMHRKVEIVEIRTSLGRIKARLFPGLAPQSVANFLRYADAKFYDETIIHRVVPNFMIEGGVMDARGEKKVSLPIPNEAGNGPKNRRGTIACARLDGPVEGGREDNPNSATSGFFINLRDNPFLDPNRLLGQKGFCVLR
jgi:peptidyl-prolyl cis-trans isomerase A (cyclophilin A)